MKVDVKANHLKFDLAKCVDGDVVVVTEGLSATMPATLLKTYLGWVHLEYPNSTWEKFEEGTHFGFKIPVGTEIVLTVERTTDD